MRGSPQPAWMTLKKLKKGNKNTFPLFVYMSTYKKKGIIFLDKKIWWT